MRIAQVSPLFESVPPKMYGGTERVVHYLTEELVKQGHEVTLFASGDSQTSARLIATVDEALRLNPNCEDPFSHHIVQLQEVLEKADEFDIIHFHTDYFHYPLSESLLTPHVTTLHGRLNIPDLQNVYNKFPYQPVVSISNDQREPLPQANFVATIYHGLPVDLLTFGKGDGGYLAFLGRISPEKGLPVAIEMAVAAGMKLKIAAKIDKADEDYYEKEIKHLLENPLIEFIGEINEEQKCEFLGKAKALLFPINWSEPFGMVMIEAMACGTPVIAHGMGSVPEVIEHNQNGFIVSSVDEAAGIIKQLDSFSRENVRRIFEERFSAERMATDYIKLFEELIDKKRQELISEIAEGNAKPIPAFTPGDINKSNVLG
jgi:glycosyltransferase involved in cell wall biosynthesis